MNQPATEQEPLLRTLEIADRLLEEGRKKEALWIVGRVLDVLEERTRELRWLLR